MALIIERDHKHGHGELYVVKGQDKGMGRGWKRDRLTLNQARAMVPHYFGHETAQERSICPVCKED